MKHTTITAKAGALSLLAVILLAAGAQAQTWSHAPWTGDADSGISSSLEYTVAVNTCGDAVTMNGVAFQSDAASGENFLIEGAPDTAGSGANIIGQKYPRDIGLFL